MNITEKHFIQLLFVPLIFCIASFCIMVSCTKSAKQGTQFPNLPLSPEIHARLDSMKTKLEIPEGLTKEEQIAYIENNVLTTPVSVSELLALQPIHTLDPHQRYWEYISDAKWEQFRLMNRFMRMQYVALGDPMDELRWVIATQVILDDYATPLAITQEQAIDSLLSAAEFLGCGTQYEINQCTYVMSSVEYYKTLAAYKDFIELMPDELQPLLKKEYTAWNKLHKARHSAYVDIIRAGDHYSALTMDLEARYAAYAEYRRQILDIEKQILSAGKEYFVQHPLVRTLDWERSIQALRDRCVDDEALAIVQELDETARAWINIRQQIAKHLPPSTGMYYDNITADYHWVITHDDEQASKMYY